MRNITKPKNLSYLEKIANYQQTAKIANNKKRLNEKTPFGAFSFNLGTFIVEGKNLLIGIAVLICEYVCAMLA